MGGRSDIEQKEGLDYWGVSAVANEGRQESGMLQAVGGAAALQAGGLPSGNRLQPMSRSAQHVTQA